MAGAALLVLAPAGLAAPPVPSSGDPAIADALREVRRKFDVPAIAGAIVTGRGLERAAVVGFRKRGDETPATLEDLWHLGSDTKAMTATLAARLVEEGRLRWDTTIGACFPDLAPSLHPATTNLTLRHLLAHRAGLPANLDWHSFRQPEIRQQRTEVVRQALASAPQSEPGSKYAYSNLGYVMAGAMIERAAGQPWEEALRERIFLPLGMTNAGFGGVGTPGRIDQPWGHGRGGVPVKANGPGVDNAPVLGPAGRVHASLADWARFVADQLRGARGEPALLRTASYATLHTPPFDGDYALGWITAERDWGGGRVLNHGGCNTMNYANVWIAPRKDFAVLVCINQGDDAAARAADAAAAALIRVRR